MAEHPIFKAKVDHMESKTLTDSPVEFTTSATILHPDLDRIKKTKGGCVLTWGEMMDDRQGVEDYLRRTVGASHSLDDPHKQDFNFLLADAHVSDIQSPDNSGGLVLAGTLAMPHVDGITFPGDIHNGKYRKVFDVRRPKSFAVGQPHSFMHTLKHSTVQNRYPLITAESQTLPHVKYPSGEIHGGSPFSVGFEEREDGTTAVRTRASPLLHGHMINNENVYCGADARPEVQQYLRPTAGDGVQTENHVHVPTKTYQECWFLKRPQYHTEKGPVVPLDDYTQGAYDFLDQVNSSRSTNFDSSGIWWNAQYFKDVPCIKMFLTLRIVPIVDLHGEGRDDIPYTNLRRHIKAQMKEMD